MDWVAERFTELFGNDNDGFGDPDHEELAAFIDEALRQINDEAAHFSQSVDPDRYSNGTRVHAKMTHIMRDPDGKPYALDVVSTNHPSTGTREIRRNVSANTTFDSMADMQLPTA